MLISSSSYTLILRRERTRGQRMSFTVFIFSIVFLFYKEIVKEDKGIHRKDRKI